MILNKHLLDLKMKNQSESKLIIESWSTFFSKIKKKTEIELLSLNEIHSHEEKRVSSPKNCHSLTLFLLYSFSTTLSFYLFSNLKTKIQVK